MPTEQVEEVRHGERRRVERKMYQGYVLVRMDMDDHSWGVVRNTPGVVNFVGSGNRPTPLPQAEVDNIFKQMKGEAPRAQVSLTLGETVKITDGPFSEFLAYDHCRSAKSGSTTQPCARPPRDGTMPRAAVCNLQRHSNGSSRPVRC